MDLQEVSDRIEIEALLTSYARAVDRGDWHLYRSVFTDDATIDYSSVGGNVGSVNEIADWLAETLPMFARSMHLISNIDIAFDESRDAAKVEAMFYNPMLLSSDGSFMTGGWYHHDVVRIANSWKSSKLVEEGAFFASLPDGRPVGP